MMRPRSSFTAARSVRVAVIAALAISAAVAVTPAAAAAPAPKVTSLAPHRAGNADRPVVAIAGTGFSINSTVTFGGQPAATTDVQTSTLIYARPPSLSGTVDVRVTTEGKTSAVTATDQYTITTPPEEPQYTDEDLGFVAGKPACGADGYCLVPGRGRAAAFSGDAAGPRQSIPKAMRDVACVSASFCAGYGPGRHAWLFDGHHWVASPQLPELSLTAYDDTAISCAGPTGCLVAKADGTWWYYNGTSWTSGTDGPKVASGKARTLDLSCGTPTFCVAAVGIDLSDGGGEISRLYRFNGSSWSGPDAFASGADRTTTVSCTSATYCFAAVVGGDVEWNGTTWTTLTATPKEAMVWVRCFAVDACLAQGRSTSSSSLGHLIRFDGTSWTDVGEIPNASPASAHIDCSSMTSCRSVTVLDYTRSWHPSTGFGAATELWNRLYGANAVSCAGGTYCVAVSAYGEMGLWDGAVWHRSVRIDRHGSPTAVSCTAADQCVVVDDAGYAVTITRAGDVLGSRQIDTQPLNSVSCGSSDFCVATDTAGRVVRFEGGSWHTPTLHGPAGALRAISCAAPSFCLAVGHGYATHYQGHGSWTTAKKIANYTLTVTCTSPTYCVVGLGAGIRIWGGQALSPPYTFRNSRNISAISCPIEQYCLAKSDGSVVPTDSAYTALDGTAHTFGALNGSVTDLTACWAPDKCLLFGGGILDGSDRVAVLR